MTAFNGTALSYDANGNLTNDGTNTYTWDARNHLVGIMGANTASFMYDADGRRSFESINGTSTSLLYDGLNPVQELQNGIVSANMLTGLDIDEFFQRADSAGIHDYLSDVLGSTVALTSTSGSIQTQYVYQPFGNSTSSGSSSSNPYQFTGRENDGSGLYSYRARYYSPTELRFISQDPIDFRGGGPNLYAYVSDDPVDATDALGLKITPCKNGDCPPRAPDGNPNWQPDRNVGGVAKWVRQHWTHPGQHCYESNPVALPGAAGAFLHCCYDSSGNPIYGDTGSAWEDYSPNSLGHYWETLWYILWLNFHAPEYSLGL
jgi:RHS repeat-associated protein